MKLWAKLWTDMLHDPKMRRIPPDWRWCWCGVLLIAAERDNDGRLEIGENDPHNDETITDALKVPPSTWVAAKVYFVAHEMLHHDGDTLVVTNWGKRQAKDKTGAERQRNHRNALRNALRNGESNGVTNDGVTRDTSRSNDGETEYRINIIDGASPLDACLSYLRNGKPVGNEGKFNPSAAVGRLYVARFGSEYPPNYGRLGRMARDLSGGYQALARVVWGCPLVDGDPHDYLAGLVKRHPGRRSAGGRSSSEGGGLAGVTDPQMLAIERMRNAQQQQTASGNGTGGTVGTAE